jgi:hypothetical protein
MPYRNNDKDRSEDGEIPLSDLFLFISVLFSILKPLGRISMS